MSVIIAADKKPHLNLHILVKIEKLMHVPKARLNGRFPKSAEQLNSVKIIMSLNHHTELYNKKMIPSSLAERILFPQQEKMYKKFMRLIAPTKDKTILNLGVNGNPKKTTDCFFEYFYPYKKMITACGLENPDEFNRIYPNINYIQIERSCELPFKDQSFDIVFCNAVIEHVGSNEVQKKFLAEILRIGKSVFITTPNRWYPVELHTVIPFLHYLPCKIHRFLLKKAGFNFFSKEENLNLLSQGRMKSLLPKNISVKFYYHYFLGLPSNIIMIYKS